MNSELELDKRISVLEKSLEWAESSIQNINKNLDSIQNTQIQIIEKLSDFKSETNQKFHEVNERITSFQSETKLEFASIRSDMNREISSLRTETIERISSLQAHTDEKFTGVYKEFAGVHKEIAYLSLLRLHESAFFPGGSQRRKRHVLNIEELTFA